MEKAIKFKNRSGRVITVDDENDVVNEFCSGIECYECPIFQCDRAGSCYEWILRNTKEAAMLMGYTLVDNDKPKSRLAEILGVEEDQEWQTKITEGDVFRVHEGRREVREDGLWVDEIDEEVLWRLINHPEYITSVAKWSDLDLKISEWILENVDGADALSRDEDGLLRVRQSNGSSIQLDSLLFRLIKDNCYIELPIKVGD